MKAHGWLKEITVPNRGSRAAADFDDDSPDAADFDDELSADLDPQDEATRVDSNTHNSSGAPLVNQYIVPYNMPTSSNHLGHQGQRIIDPQQEAICLQALGLQPMGFPISEDAYTPSDMATEAGYPHGNWHPKASVAAPIMEHSFSAPGRMAVRW